MSVNGLSLKYEDLMASFDGVPPPGEVGAVVLDAAADRYQAQMRDKCALVTFEQSGAMYCFDLASSAGLPQADRTIAGWMLTPGTIDPRDTSYQRASP